MRLASIVFFGMFAMRLIAADWVAAGAPGALEASKDGVVTLRYTADPAAFSLAVLPVTGASFARTKSIRFEIKTDSPFAATVLLAEKKPGGGNYSSVIWSNGDIWQPVTLIPADFTIGDGPKDPVDTDNRLDLDQVENVALLDLSQFFSGLPKNPDAPLYVEPHSGAHLISIRKFEILTDGPSSPTGMVVDDFSHPQPAWFTFGGASFEQRDGTLAIRYRQMPDRWVAFSRLMPMADRGATHLAFDISSERDAHLVLSFKERKSGTFHTDFLVSAGPKLVHREIALSALGDVNLANIQSITILDISGEDAPNTLRLHDLRFVKR